MTLLEVKNLSFVVKERTILHDVSFRLEAGQWLGILGSNGAGKTTLIKCLNNSVNYLGKIYYADKNSKSFKHKQRARFISILSQITNISYSYTVKDIVELGLYSCEDYIKNSTNHTVEKVLKQIGLDEFANRSVLSLSGGEVQRVFFAQAILQNPKVMILDEPTNHLDLKYQKLFFDGIKSWIKQNNTAVISILHDIHIASKYTDHVLFLKSGEKFAFGCTNELMTNENLSNLFDVDIVKLYK